MDFRKYRIQPEGRNRYGVYTSTQNMSRQITYASYAGNVTTETNTDQGSSQGEPYTPQKDHTYILFLLSTQGNFDGEAMAIMAQSATSRVVSYVDSTDAPSYIGDPGNSGATNYGITGIPVSGMTVLVQNNGTSATTLVVAVDNTLSAATGTLTIPCYMPRNGETGMGDDWDCWNSLLEEGSLYSANLEWNWAASRIGADGAPGPAVRGPIDWYSGITSNRRFCNGEGPLDSDKKFIDILLKDGVYYECTTSYDATPSDLWENVSSAWTAADQDYDFVATQLLLAENAKITFLSNNALMLTDGNGTVTGGAQGGSGETIAFWAGSSSPSSGNFQVTHSGKIVAKQGKFGCLSISANDQFGNSTISGETGGLVQGEPYKYTMELSPEIIRFTGADTSQTLVGEEVVICPYMNPDTMDFNGALNVIAGENLSVNPERRIGIFTNEQVQTPRVLQDYNNLGTNWAAGGVPTTPSLFGMYIIFQTSDTIANNHFTKDGPMNTWRFHNMETNTPYANYTQVKIDNSDGFWYFYTDYNTQGPCTGVAGPNAVKFTNALYIKI